MRTPSPKDANAEPKSPNLIQSRLAELIKKQKDLLKEIKERNKKNEKEINRIDDKNQKITGIFTDVLKK